MGLRELAAERVGRVVREHSFIAGVVLFGSVARGEEGERSDVDLLVLWEGLDERKAARVVYEAVSKHFPPGVGLTVLESDYWRFVRASKATALLVNLAYDGLVLYDKYGVLSEFLSRVKRRLEEEGFSRKKHGKYYYWELPRPGAKVVL